MVNSKERQGIYCGVFAAGGHGTERKRVQYMSNIVFPLGIVSFEKIRTEGYYYIDKTEIIAELLRKTFEVNLITRPRRFGKTLAMDTMASFFDIRKDTRKLFSGLHIEKYKEICGKWQNQWPVLFLSLKEVDDKTFDQATKKLAVNISDLYKEHTYLLKSNKVDPADAELFNKIRYQKADSVDIQNALYILMRMMQAYFGKQVIVLIDEYDVPLAKASENGFYDDMLNVVRGLLGKTLKTNPFLKFAVITGCLRIAQESIFTGTNNFVSDTITGERFNEYFGFTEEDVHKLLQDTGYGKHFDEIKYWYNGYRFGSIDIYCPWDVINFAKKLVSDPSARPSAFWINSSGNDMVKRFVDKADQTTRDEIEKLVAGGFVEKQLRLDLTYDEIDNTIDNLWSVLFTTGYLTKIGEVKVPDSESYAYKLVIPNKEVREVFILQIQEWFKAVVAKDDDTMKLLSRAILDKDEKQIARQLNIVMSRMISILDTKAPDAMKENFYHGLLLGLLRGSNPDWLIKSNRESGDGFSDILIMPEDPDAGIVIEVKYAKEMKELDAACEAAMAQIKNKRYDEALRDEGRCDILAYGIAFCRKRCRVVGEKL